MSGYFERQQAGEICVKQYDHIVEKVFGNMSLTVSL